jgi:colanic acid/amylovoran biosynthesis glycosyltransferase
MRLVMIVPRFPQLPETFIVNKFVGLVDAGWDVHIVCQRESDVPWDVFTPLQNRPDLRGRVHTQWPHDTGFLAALLWLPAFLATLFRVPRATWDYLCRGRQVFGASVLKQFYLDARIIALAPDLIHFEFGTLAVGRTYLKRSLGCCLTASFRGYDLSYVGLENPEFYRDVWQDADALHLLGEDLWQRAVSRGCPAEMPHVLIPPAIDISYFAGDPQERDTVTISPERPLRIVSVGRLKWVKGYEYALEAVAALREMGVPFEYHVVGGGDYLEALCFTRHQLNLEESVHFLGPRPHAVVIEEMLWADVFLHSAVSEGFCNAVLEAQAMQLPVVSSDADGLPENVQDGVTGLIVPRRNPVAAAESLACLAADPALRRTMGRAGRERVAHYFQLPDQIAAFNEFYRTMTNGHGN